MNSLLGQLRPFGPLGRGCATHGMLFNRMKSPCFVQSAPRRGILTTSLADPGFLSTLPANLMVGVHEVGVPWAVALPLTALAIRSALIYPWFQRTRRANQAKMAMLQPLVDAKMAQAYTANALLDRTNLRADGPKPSLTKIFTWRSKASRMRRKIEDQLEKDFKAPSRRWSSKIIPLLILLAVSEAVRRICGISGGLLSLLLGPVVRLFGAAPLGETQAVLYADSDTGIEGQLTNNDDPSLQSFMDQRDDFVTSSWLQDSLKTGGFSWFQDLTLPDPTLILPVIFSGTFFASIWFSPGAVKPGNFYSSGDATTTNERATPKRTFWQKVFLVFSAFSVIPASTMPCALLLYFIGNIAVSRLQTAWLMRRFPIVVPPMACAQRPTMMSRLGHKEGKVT